MLIVIAALLTATAFVVLVRLLWVSARPDRYKTLITLAAAALARARESGARRYRRWLGRPRVRGRRRVARAGPAP